MKRDLIIVVSTLCMATLGISLFINLKYDYEHTFRFSGEVMGIAKEKNNSCTLYVKNEKEIIIISNLDREFCSDYMMPGEKIKIEVSPK